MKITLVTVGDYIEFYNLFSKKVKEMSPKEIKKILTDKDLKYHESMKTYQVCILLNRTLSKQELKKVKDEDFESFFNRVKKEEPELSAVKYDKGVFTRMVVTSADLLNNEVKIWVDSFSDKEIENLMFKSCEKGDLETLETLLKGGVNPNICDDQNFTPLFTAAENGQAEAVKILIESGSKVDHMTNTGDSPLHAAVLSGNIDIVKELINTGAEQSIANKGGLTPLQTIKSLLKDIEKWNTKWGSDPNKKSRSLLKDNSIQGSEFEKIAKYLEKNPVKTKAKRSEKTKAEEMPW